jgi:hypothetical protein
MFPKFKKSNWCGGAYPVTLVEKTYPCNTFSDEDVARREEELRAEARKKLMYRREVPYCGFHGKPHTVVVYYAYSTQARVDLLCPSCYDRRRRVETGYAGGED